MELYRQNLGGVLFQGAHHVIGELQVIQAFVARCVPDADQVLLVAADCQPVSRRRPGDARDHFLFLLDLENELESVEVHLILALINFLLLDAVNQDEADVADGSQTSALRVKLGVEHLVGMPADGCQASGGHQTLRAVVVAEQRVGVRRRIVVRALVDLVLQ